MGVIEGAALVQWVNASCVAQGLPLLVTDAGVIARVCTLLGGRAPGPERSMRRRDPAKDRLEAPGRDDPAGVEGAGTGRAGQDRDVVDHGLDGGGLPTEVQT